MDELTQWEVVGAAPQISEAWLIPVLEAKLAQFPFPIVGFHSDCGSEFINHTVAKLLNKLLIDQAKSRPRHSNENGLAEAKNGAVIQVPPPPVQAHSSMRKRSLGDRLPTDDSQLVLFNRQQAPIPRIQHLLTRPLLPTSTDACALSPERSSETIFEPNLLQRSRGSTHNTRQQLPCRWPSLQMFGGSASGLISVNSARFDITRTANRLARQCQQQLLHASALTRFLP